MRGVRQTHERAHAHTPTPHTFVVLLPHLLLELVDALSGEAEVGGELAAPVQVAATEQMVVQDEGDEGHVDAQHNLQYSGVGGWGLATENNLTSRTFTLSIPYLVWGGMDGSWDTKDGHYGVNTADEAAQGRGE